MNADTGLAAQRTALSWRRTAIGAVAVGLLFLQHAVVLDTRAAVLTPLVAAVTMIALGLLCFVRNRRLRRDRRGARSALIATTAAAVVVVAGMAALVGFTNPNF
ncbi:DUF202 domain-containing protein [Nocardia bovistercoris]|uniref:DUF202 domain-containing protein n=1 Tax=Nocardia bovistercoris TaxID=2785916 RepID=A0A931N165_9NOCA|nr:DUF202 domain-containing protein [Nocardia bovistercoris]MBH0775372.1 DUF202 domain-containing protein [Nocardia bovistercoris]